MNDAFPTQHIHCWPRTGSAVPIAQRWKSTDQQLSDGITMASYLPADRQNQVQ